jgi:release factor glutamine methyltransferase
VRVIAGLKAGVSISEAARSIAQNLRLAGVEMPEADARALLGHALHLTRAQLLSQSDRLLESREVDSVSALTARRKNREPVSRIIGVRNFWTLTLQVTPDVLDPRPDTETVVEEALDFVTRNKRRQDALKILDIGTGSGALLLALLSELPHATGVATDISPTALAVARANAERNALSARCDFILSNIADGASGLFDIIVSNPPYIRHDEIATLEPEVRDYDPQIALNGGADGLEAYRAISEQAERLLAPGGMLFVELGATQKNDVSALFTKAGLKVISTRADLAGIPRVLSAIPASGRHLPMP